MLTAAAELDPREYFNRLAGRIQRLEDDLRAANATVRLVERDLPVMLAYLDAGERYRFHNQAYRRWLGKTADDISGRPMRSVLGEALYDEIAARIRTALSGVPVRYERAHRAPDGTEMRVHVHLIPSFNDQRTVTGFYSLVIDHTEQSAPIPGLPVPEEPWLVQPIEPQDDAAGATELYEGAVAREREEWGRAAQRIREAIRNDEFQLYCQEIRDLSVDVPPFYGILLRQAEEEQNNLPPGAFFALAEEYGLMSELDRWMVSGVLAWAASRMRGRADWRVSMYCIALSRDSIGDPYFPEFVHEQAAHHGVPPEALCFEIPESDAAALPADAAELARNLRAVGCRVMIGGFGREKAALDLLKDVHFDFLKIDGSIILGLARSEASLARLKSIVRLAHTVGINTVAELVESAEIVERLRELEVDYAQGFAISGAMPLAAID